MSIWVGLDISKDTIDVGFVVDGEEIHFQIQNTKIGFRKLIKQIPKNAKVLMEATGIYYLACAKALDEKGIFVSVENPYKINQFSKMKMRRTKSDKKDAFLIAKFGEFMSPEPWEKPSDEQLKSQQILTAIDLQSKMIIQISNQLHSFKRSGIIDRELIKTLEKNINVLEKSKKALEKKLEKFIKPKFKKEFDLLKSIPGIGASTVCMVLSKVGDFSTFETARQLSAYFGITPMERYSGTSINVKGSISRIGDSRIRKQLYMCSLSAIRANPFVKEMHSRMKEKGKHNKKILVAAMNKLVKQMFGIIKSGIPFNSEFDRKSLAF